MADGQCPWALNTHTSEEKERELEMTRLSDRIVMTAAN